MSLPDPVARLTDEQVDEIRTAFRDSGYTSDGVLERIGDAGQRGLQRNSTVAALDALGDATDPQATLIRLFVLQQDVPAKHISTALPVGNDAVRAALLTESGTRARIDVRPYASNDGFSGWVASDLVTTLDTAAVPARPDFVLGVSPASMTLAQLALRHQVGSALDLGVGCGVQSLHLAAHAHKVVATDVNPRALDLSRLTARLNHVDFDLRLGSLYEPVAGEKYDLILTNPPYVMSPPRSQADRLTYREAGLPGDDLMRRVVTEAPSHLTEGGILQVLGNWAHTSGDWRDRLASWVPAGYDALILQREFLDPYEYAELWLADAGLAGTPVYLERYREWLDYFDGLGVTGVGLGWVLLRNSGSSNATVRIEEWPHAVAQPVSTGFAEFVRGSELSRLPTQELLALKWLLADDTIQESLGQPGAADPQHVVLRRQTGFCRAIEVDTALGGVLGACDGELPLGTLIAAVAQLLGEDPIELTADLVDRLRPLVESGWLTPAS